MIKANQRIAIMNLKASNIVRRPEGYIMRRSGLSWWRGKLASWCWRLLHKLRAVEQYWYTETVYVYELAHQKQITERFMSGIDEVFKRGHDVNDYCMVMGAADFSEMLQSEPLRQHMILATQEINYQRDGYRMRFMGLPIHVVPGIEGMAVFPKVIVEKIVYVTPDGKPRMDMNGPGIQPEIIERFDRPGSY
jgi:hypothetical protein